jgi:hypothetical protein
MWVGLYADIPRDLSGINPAYNTEETKLTHYRRAWMLALAGAARYPSSCATQTWPAPAFCP